MLNLKKKLFTIALSLFCAGQLMAVPALPGKMVAKQADGTMITIQKLGDEHYHMTVTEDGYPLKYNFATNNYEYAELTEQGLVSSPRSSSQPPRSTPFRASLPRSPMPTARSV